MADRFFRQPIDHFRPSLGTFDQRYYVRDSYVKTGATSTPLLLFLGGEVAVVGGCVSDAYGSGLLGQRLTQVGRPPAHVRHGGPRLSKRWMFTFWMG